MPNLEPMQFVQGDPGFAEPKLEYGLFPQFPSETVSSTDEFLIIRDGRGILMRQRRDYGSMPEFLEHPVKTPDDWAKIKAERLKPDDPARVALDWDAFRGRLRQSGEAVQVGNFPWGVFGTVRDLLGAEQVLLAFYDYPEMVRDMMSTLVGIWIGMYERVAREVPIDHIHIWEDMSANRAR